MKITIDSAYKSIPKGVTFDLPDFCVITGINGTGKSHLLEAIADEKISTVLDDGKPLKKFILLALVALRQQLMTPIALKMFCKVQNIGGNGYSHFSGK
ncbi:TPA: hypothetical protein RRT88_004712 [Klebsiella pneumoniae]|nr:hypothetical protein [Klebsiella pneumoniae]